MHHKHVAGPPRLHPAQHIDLSTSINLSRIPLSPSHGRDAWGGGEENGKALSQLASRAMRSLHMAAPRGSTRPISYT